MESLCFNEECACNHRCLVDRHCVLQSVEIPLGSLWRVTTERESDWGSISAALIRSLMRRGSVENRVTYQIDTPMNGRDIPSARVRAPPPQRKTHWQINIFLVCIKCPAETADTRVKPNSTVKHIVHWTQIVEGRYYLWKMCDLLGNLKLNFWFVIASICWFCIQLLWLILHVYLY